MLHAWDNSGCGECVFHRSPKVSLTCYMKTCYSTEMDLSNIFYCIFLSVMKQNSATNLLEDSNPCPCNIQITGPVWNLLNISSVLRWFIAVILYFYWFLPSYPTYWLINHFRKKYDVSHISIYFIRQLRFLVFCVGHYANTQFY